MKSAGDDFVEIRFDRKDKVMTSESCSFTYNQSIDTKREVTNHTLK